MEVPGTYVFGVPELEREIAVLDHTCTDWAPREQWNARLSGGINFRQATECVVNITWYEEGGDPMLQLKEIVATLDFIAVAAELVANRELA